MKLPTEAIIAEADSTVKRTGGGGPCGLSEGLLRRQGNAMLLFAHVGITLGTAVLLARLVPCLQSSPGAVEEHGQSTTGTPSRALPGAGPQDGGASGVSALARYLDIRVLLVGSLLPDVIDKPVGYVLFRETFSGGRIFGHTLLFAVVLGVMGLYVLRRYHKEWVITLALRACILFSIACGIPLRHCSGLSTESLFRGMTPLPGLRT